MVTMCKFNRGLGTDIQPHHSPQPRHFRSVILSGNIELTISQVKLFAKYLPDYE